MRGRWLELEIAEKVIATVHPSSIIEARDRQTREKEYEEFVRDLRVAAAALRPAPLVQNA